MNTVIKKRKITIMKIIVKLIQNNLMLSRCIILTSLCFSILTVKASITNQDVSIETPTLVLNSTENSAVASVTLNIDQLYVNALTFSIQYDKEIVTPTLTNIFAAGAYNSGDEGIIYFSLFNINSFTTTSQIAEISFDFIGASGTASPLEINIAGIYDVTNADISNSAQVIEGSISKICATTAVYGCTNDRFQEYSPLANCDDGSCSTLHCLDPNYQKYTQFENPVKIQSYISDDGHALVSRESNNFKLLKTENGSWVQNAADLTSQSNFVVNDFSISGDGEKIVFISTDSSTPSNKHIETYELVNNQWVKPGSDIIFNTFINKLGMSKDGNSLYFFHPTALYFQVYAWDGITWQQKGSNISASNFAEISADGNSILIRESSNVGYLNYAYNGTDWVQKGAAFPIGNYTLSDNGNSILLIETTNNPFARDVSIFEWNGTNWNLRDSSYTVTGSHIRISGDFNTIGASNQWNYINLYKFNGENWELSAGINLENNGFPVLDYKLSANGNALIARGYSFDDDNIDIFSFYANDCHAVSQTFCADTYTIEGIVEAGLYSSENIIYTYGLVNINSNGTVEMESENFIDLLPGFNANGVVNFEAKNAECNP